MMPFSRGFKIFANGNDRRRKSAAAKHEMACVTSLLRYTFAFAKALDEKKQHDAVFLDYIKAFDSVSFNCLLRELYGVGIRGNLLPWFRSYLTDRLHMTVIDGCASSLLLI